MGFRSGAFATIWEVTPFSDTLTKGRISISKKNRDTGEYETDFSSFVGFIGSAAASKAARLKERDRIRIGNIDVTTKYIPEKKITYYNFNIFSFENADEIEGNNSHSNTSQAKPTNSVDSGEVENEDVEDLSDLPF